MVLLKQVRGNINSTPEQLEELAFRLLLSFWCAITIYYPKYLPDTKVMRKIQHVYNNDHLYFTCTLIPTTSFSLFKVLNMLGLLYHTETSLQKKKKKRLILQLRVVVKGQFVPFDARLDNVNKCLQLETIEKNLADTEKTPLGTQGKVPDPGGCTHFVRFQAQLTKPLTQPQRESADTGHTVQRWMRGSLGIPSSALH